MYASGRYDAKASGPPPSALSQAHTAARLAGCSLVDPLTDPPDSALALAWGPHQCLRDLVLPWRRIGGAVIVLVTDTASFARHRPRLQDSFGTVRMALTTEHQLTGYITATFGAHLTARAETRVPDAISSRSWNARLTMGLAIGLGIGLVALFIVSPAAGFALLSLWAVVTLLTNTLLKAAAAGVGLFSAPNLAKIPPLARSEMPPMTILIPLYKEKEVAGHLLKRVSKLDYPRDRLDLCFVMEADDDTTRKAVAAATLPNWVRPIVVPKGTLKTKPRALNYALDFAKGDIVGVYDAEDAPAPDQLRIAARYFAHLGPKVACLQGVLDYYNAPSNWLTRCFTLEYAAWFRVILPGLERLGMVVPLGGTTLFFRREVLERLGAWDAHNVTEDADLGVRLVRQGYSTALIATTTQEEANGRAWPWVKQRSRWLKGYMITYGVHMRAPRQLYRDLGAKRFWGFQILFAGTLSQFLLAPVLWSFWVIPFGIAHPMGTYLSGNLFLAVIACFILSEVTNMFTHALGVSKAGKMWLIKWIPSLHLYFPMAALAAYKGLYELASNPFYWDKTTHGLLVPGEATATESAPHPVSDG